jgi:hypothetical protein
MTRRLKLAPGMKRSPNTSDEAYKTEISVPARKLTIGYHILTHIFGKYLPFQVARF